MKLMQWFGGQVRGLFAQGHHMVYGLLLFVVLDYITGVCVAVQTHQLSSEIGTKGITRKIAIFIVIAFCHILDTYVIERDAALEPISMVFYLTNEAISILENIARLGVPLPEKLKAILKSFEEQLQKRDDSPKP